MPGSISRHLFGISLCATALWALTACSGEPVGGPGDCSGPGCEGAAVQDPSECEDLPCKERWAVAAWPNDPAGVQRYVAAMTDSVEQLVLVQTLSETYPGQTGALCAVLPLGAGASRCQQINARPHLRAKTGKKPPLPGEEGAAPVPLDPGHVLAPESPLPTEDWAPRTADCANPALASTCQEEAAVAAAEAGDFDAAGGYCAAIEADLWRHECFFRASEELGLVDRGAQMGGAIAICSAAEPFVAQCLEHLSRYPRQWVTPGSIRGEGWETVRAGDAAARTAIGTHDAGLAARFLSMYWGYAISQAYNGVSAPTGDLADAVPPEWALHVRAAVARQLWAAEGTEARSLVDWGAQVVAQMDARAEGALASAAPTDRYPRPDACSYWPLIMPDESEIPHHSFLGQSHRAVSEDPAIDARIVTLEAAVRAPGERGLALVLEGLEDPAPLVRWTATRLLAALDPNHAAFAPLKIDRDPAVKARARQSHGLHCQSSAPDASARPGGPDPNKRGPDGSGGGPDPNKRGPEPR